MCGFVRRLEVCYQIRAVDMLVIVGLSVLLVAGIAAIVDALSNAGRPTRRPKLCVFGYHPSGATGVFPFGIMVGAVALVELSVLWTGARRTADTTPGVQPPTSDVTWRSPT